MYIIVIVCIKILHILPAKLMNFLMESMTLMMTNHQRIIENGKVYINSDELAAISDELIAVLYAYESTAMMDFLVHKIVEDTKLYALLLQKNPACHYDLQPLSKYHLSGKLAIINDTLKAYIKQNQSSFSVENNFSARKNRQNSGNLYAGPTNSRQIRPEHKFTPPYRESFTSEQSIFKTKHNRFNDAPNQNNQSARFSSQFGQRGNNNR